MPTMTHDIRPCAGIVVRFKTVTDCCYIDIYMLLQTVLKNHRTWFTLYFVSDFMIIIRYGAVPQIFQCT